MSSPRLRHLALALLAGSLAAGTAGGEPSRGVSNGVSNGVLTGAANRAVALVPSAPSFEVPAWAFPHQAPPAEPAADDKTVLHLEGSMQGFTRAQLADLFFTPDWFPGSHGPLPQVVAQGRKPDVNACGYCHTPRGQGRPENASLAGLPAKYIRAQIADFRSGARRSAVPLGSVDRMIAVAQHASANDVAQAAEYFSRQSLDRRVDVHEHPDAPRTRIVGYVYAPDPAGGIEPIGDRLLEVASDIDRHELRDERIVYDAYVPPGTIARGRGIARQGAAPVPACQGCHGPDLRGLGEAPPIAGRSPTYLLRQLVAFRTGARAGAGAKPMKEVVAGLSLKDMVAVAAYAASLEP